MNIQYKLASVTTFEDTIDKLKEKMALKGFGVLWELNFQDKLREKGFDYTGNFKILEACHPAKAQKILTHNIEAGYFLPCKVVVYEKNQEVWMGMLKPTELMTLMGDDALMDLATEVEETLIEAMKEVNEI